MDQSVIVLEFNELTPHLLERWMGEGRLPGFRKLYENSIVYTTDAEEMPPTLEPWIQWITVHTGLRYSEHGIFDLGDGHKLKAPRIWDVVSEAGRKVWVCGSMNAGFQPDGFNGYILPDPWSTGFKPFPNGKFEDFFHFVRTSVQEYTRDKAPLSRADYFRFVKFLLRNGLSVETVRRTAFQLLDERGGKYKWRRAMILDRLMWDLFRSQWRRMRPHYSTLFLNSTAHLQHFHWRNLDPTSFSIKPGEVEQDEYQHAILEGYQAMDKIIEEAIALVEGTSTSIVLMSALSQQPLSRYDSGGGKQLFRPIDPVALLAFAGVAQKATFEPVMSEEFRYVFESESHAAESADLLLGLRCGDAPVMRVKQSGRELFCACDIISLPDEQQLVTSASHGKAAKFYSLFYPVLSIKSGGHHPEGVFWVRKPTRAHRIETGLVPLRRTTSTLALLAGIPTEVASRRFKTEPLPL